MDVCQELSNSDLTFSDVLCGLGLYINASLIKRFVGAKKTNRPRLGADSLIGLIELIEN